MAQLYTHNASDMAEKTGLMEDIFHVELWGKNTKEQERKSKVPEVSARNKLLIAKCLYTY